MCHKCTKRGHFASVCRTPARVRDIHEDTNTFLGGVSTPETDNNNNPWRMSIRLNNTPTEFDIDTGAEVSVISKTRHDEIGHPPLASPDRVLRGPSNRCLPVLGQFKGVLKRGNHDVQQEIFVVQNLSRNLLGRPAIEALKLTVRVAAIFDNTSPMQLFPKMFQGLGKLQGQYVIELKDNHKPFAISVPRRVAVPLLGKVRAELERMEQLGVVAKVDTPTDWCAGMVVVPKPNSTLRICVDLTKLNQSVCREHHPLPAVEQTLAQLAGAQVFTKLDVNSGFWQIPLSHDSALLTTFLTPFRRYCFHRLPFGITSAPEHFQRRMSMVLDRLEGVVCLLDDILVYGKMHDEHDERLLKVLQRLEKARVTLNKEKCEFSRSKIKFLGQIMVSAQIQLRSRQCRSFQYPGMFQTYADFLVW